MNVKIKILLDNKTLNQKSIDIGIGSLSNNEIYLKTDENIFKIIINSNIMFIKENQNSILNYKFINKIHTVNNVFIKDSNLNVGIDIITKNILIKDNIISINFEKYIGNEKEECLLKINYEEVNI